MSKVNKDQTVYALPKVVNGVAHYVLCEDALTNTHVFSFKTGDWTDNLTTSDVYLHLETLLVKAFKTGFKEVVEIVADQTTDDSIRFVVKKYTEKRGIDFPMYLFVDFENKEYKWLDLRFWYKTEIKAIAAVDNYPDYRKMRLTESVVEAKTSPPKIKKPKKARPPSETRRLEKEIIETVKKKRLASIALAEENADPYLRKQHANDVKTHEQTLKTLKARFPKWVFTWER